MAASVLWKSFCIQIVSDDFSGSLSKNQVYSSAKEEKTVRAALKSSTERYLNPGVYGPYSVFNAHVPFLLMVAPNTS